MILDDTYESILWIPMHYMHPIKKKGRTKCQYGKITIVDSYLTLSHLGLLKEEKPWIFYECYNVLIMKHDLPCERFSLLKDYKIGRSYPIKGFQHPVRSVPSKGI